MSIIRGDSMLEAMKVLKGVSDLDAKDSNGKTAFDIVSTMEETDPEVYKVLF
mgnify:CR=1 FL=1